jgi:hypothetical protein
LLISFFTILLLSLAQENLGGKEGLPRSLPSR